ncbi:MAG: anthranilate synthase component I family protein [Ghiorsea sp.]
MAIQSFECAGLLEDPKGSGKQFLVSKAGHAECLHDIADAKVFFKSWKECIHQSKPFDFPTLKHVFYTAYEAGSLFESLPQPKTVPEGGLIWRHEPQWCVCYAHDESKIYLSSTQSESELDDLEKRILNTQDTEEEANFCSSEVEHPQKNYQAAVERVREYISQGDIFQANIARFWHMPFEQGLLRGLYSKLRKVNPAPFATFLNAGGLTILSASPERLFSISALGEVAARPIAGTRKRSEGDEDDKLSDELLLSEKERAEHIMLVDLERNDLGRVCKPGSIHVDECMIIEKYATVQHIVSNVKGQLQDGLDMLDVLQAMFPGGTITGCPKVRCMEIIHELEDNARGPYTGGIGYMAWDGSVDMNILIRTFWHWQGQLKWAAGAGIVADSNAEHEELETEYKVAGLMRVFQ